MEDDRYTAGNVGGIRLQVHDGRHGYLVSSVKQAADRTVQLLRDDAKRKALGRPDGSGSVGIS